MTTQTIAQLELADNEVRVLIFPIPDIEWSLSYDQSFSVRNNLQRKEVKWETMTWDGKHLCGRGMTPASSATAGLNLGIFDIFICLTQKFLLCSSGWP